MTSDRTCVRGCTLRDVHYAACPDYGKTDGDCRGCVEADARDGAMLCDGCYRALRGCLEDAADVVGHLRTIADPSKSSWNFDRLVLAGRVELPDPVQASIIDASNDITIALRAWALDVQFGVGHPWKASGLEAGADSGAAYEDAVACADLILDDLDRLVNLHDVAVKLYDDFAARSKGDPSRWTVADAIARWPLNDQPRTAEQPCPGCGVHAVRVLPPRRTGMPTRYLCRKCSWVADSTDDAGLWDAVFREDVVREDARPHDPRWLTLAAAARLAKRTPTTVRNWAEKGAVRRVDGRYWRDDVEAKAAGTVPAVGQAPSGVEVVAAAALEGVAR